ncbi:MAG: alpha/beta fold hydrolase [Phycisphaeraceae bacterium]|nr:alpha/beta fold hydrolase [Phycisphaerales bacterium]MCB9858982.1 alpha/beta fold hydrolase [Phycisphaeraceae bacterium]
MRAVCDDPVMHVPGNIPARFSQFPKSLSDRAVLTRLGPDVPALLAHPDGETPVPVVLWLHGRSVFKELDPGRYLRWIRSGIAACAIDLPGHGERTIEGWNGPEHTLDVLEQVIGEIDDVIDDLSRSEHAHLYDTSRVAIGGMSAGGMAALRRLCEPHRFACAAVEATCGDLETMYFGDSERVVRTRTDDADTDRRSSWPIVHDRERVLKLSAMEHLSGFDPIPFLAIHSEADRVVPFDAQAKFIDALRSHYERSGSDASMIEFVHWTETGAPDEHNGFGNRANDAKNAQTSFFVKHLLER